MSYTPVSFNDLEADLKNVRNIAALSTFFLAFSPLVSLLAQTAASPTEKLVLKEGTDVKLRFAQEVSSKTAAEGDPINFVLDDDLKVGDAVVVKAGAKAVGTVSNARKAGMMGKGGELNVRLEHLKTADGRVRLRGTKGKEGDSKTGTAVALTVLFGPIGLIKHGKEIVVKEGTVISAFVDDDISLSAVK